MAFTLAEMLSDAELAWLDFPTETVTISSNSYSALRLREETFDDTYDVGGKRIIRNVVLGIRKSDMPTRPTDGTLATFSGQTLRIKSVIENTPADPWEITLDNEGIN